MHGSRTFLSSLLVVAILALSVGVFGGVPSAFAAEGTAIDGGFESGAEGGTLATPPWTASGTAQHREYDNARAAVGSDVRRGPPVAMPSVVDR
jgi:hypothetical protein